MVEAVIQTQKAPSRVEKVCAKNTHWCGFRGIGISARQQAVDLLLVTQKHRRFCVSGEVKI